MKKLILGLGNEILGDDAFGPIVAGMLRKSPVSGKADIATSSASGLRLLDAIEGYDSVLIIDTWLAPERMLGEIVKVEIAGSTGPLPSSSSHFWSFSHALQAGRAMGMKIPDRIEAICAVIHGYEFSEKIQSPELEKAACAAVLLVENEFSKTPC